ncbi:MAG: ATP-binding protein [Anaerovoracaceae bacterium]
MVIMNIEMDNIYLFKNFKMNMSYPKKIVNSSIENEFLTGRENFRYKKVNVLMGPNASGKTTLGKALLGICRFLLRRESGRLLEIIRDYEKPSIFSMDFVNSENGKYKMYRLNMEMKVNSTEPPIVKTLAQLRETDITIRDSYESCCKKIEKEEKKLNTEIDAQLDKIIYLGWLFSFTSEADAATHCAKEDSYEKILEYTLKTLDSSIVGVEKLKEVENSYVIKYPDQDIIIQDGEVVKNNILSSGTREGLDIAYFIAGMQRAKDSLFYCDEKFSHVHSDIEKECLSLMIDSLSGDGQLFFTTHNIGVLDMNLPHHTFTFMGKEKDGDDSYIKCAYADDYLKRHTDSLKNAVANDLFSMAPDLNYIDTLRNYLKI